MTDVNTTPPKLGRTGSAGPAALALPIILTGTFMVILDFFIVNVAIPAIESELDASTGQVQLIVAGYGLAYACGQITAGRLGDLFGRRRLYLIGLLLFTAASLLCGVAPNAPVLVLARVLQGIGAAVIAPQALTILGVTYTGAARARAFTAYGLVMAAASVGGQLIGGALIQADIAGLGWRSCFLINVPIGAAALLLAPRVVQESRAEGNSRLDIPGMVLVTLGLVAVVLPLVEGREAGWPAWTWWSLALSAPLLAVFARHQHLLSARGGAPLLDLALFRQRAFSVGLLAVSVFYSGMASFFLILALYLQQGRGLSALDAGFTFTAIGAGFAVATALGKRLAASLGRQVLALGGALIAVGHLVLELTVSRIGVDGSTWALTPALLVGGAGMGLVMAPLNSVVLAGIPPRLAGAASGVLTTMIQVGNALGVALIGIVYYDRASALPQSVADGFDAGLVYLIALAAVLVVAVQLLPKKPTQGPAQG